MPRALAIETSGRIGSVAVVDDGAVILEQAFQHGLKHAAELVPMLDRFSRQQGWAPADIQELYVSAGPGSFTGLRIGITVAKTMAMATGVRLVAVPSVRVLVENAPPDAANVIIVLDAKRDQIFTARFERIGSNWIEREPAHLDTLLQMLARSPRPVWLIGEGIPFHRKFLDQAALGVVVTGEESWRARASAVAKVGLEMARHGTWADPLRLTPIYIRRPEAEEKWEAAKK